MDRLVSVLAAFALGACSLSISAPVRDRKRNQLPVCDTAKGLVAIDALAAVGFGVGGLAALAENEGTGALALVGGALFAAAALHGSGNADKCREAFTEYAKETNSVAPPIDEVVRRPRKRPTRVVPEEPPDEIEEPPAPVAAKLPATVGQKPEPPPEPKPEPKPAKPPAKRVEDWGQFWREVP